MWINDRIWSLVSFSLVMLTYFLTLIKEKKTCDLLAKSHVPPIAVNAQLVYNSMCKIVLQPDNLLTNRFKSKTKLWLRVMIRVNDSLSQLLTSFASSYLALEDLGFG